MAGSVGCRPGADWIHAKRHCDSHRLSDSWSWLHMSPRCLALTNAFTFSKMEAFGWVSTMIFTMWGNKSQRPWLSLSPSPFPVLDQVGMETRRVDMRWDLVSVPLGRVCRALISWWTWHDGRQALGSVEPLTRSQAWQSLSMSHQICTTTLCRTPKGRKTSRKPSMEQSESQRKSVPPPL